MAAIIFCLLTTMTYVYRTKQAERSTVSSAPLTSFSMLSADTHDTKIQPILNDNKAEDTKSLSNDQIPKNKEGDKSQKDDKKNEKELSKRQQKEDKEEKKSKKERKDKDKKSSSSEKETSSKKDKDSISKKTKKEGSSTDNEEQDEDEETYNGEKQSKLPMMHGSRDTPPHIVFILGMYVSIPLLYPMTDTLHYLLTYHSIHAFYVIYSR